MKIYPFWVLALGLAFASSLSARPVNAEPSSKPGGLTEEKPIGDDKSQSSTFSLILKNDSVWTIQHIYLSPADEDDWGIDQLGDLQEINRDKNLKRTGKSPLKSQEEFELKDIPRGEYDIKLVDEDNDTCIVTDIPIIQDKTLLFDDQMLVACMVVTEDEGLE